MNITIWSGENILVKVIHRSSQILIQSWSHQVGILVIGKCIKLANKISNIIHIIEVPEVGQIKVQVLGKCMLLVVVIWSRSVEIM